MTYAPGTYVLRLTGPAPASHFEAVLRTLTYDNSADEPTPNPTPSRTISFVVRDDSFTGRTAYTTILFNYTNDIPLLDLNGDSDPANGLDVVRTCCGGEKSLAL